MAQKINPVSLRLGKTNRNFDYCWFNTSSYVNLLMKDLKIQSYVNSILKKINCSSARCAIQHFPNKIKINVFFCNLNKNFKHMSKISYLSHRKKIRKSEKKFFNRKLNHSSMKHGKVFNYLIKNFSINHNLSQIQQFKKINNYNVNLNTVGTSNLNSNLHENNSIFLKNYSKLIYSITKLNQFHIRYFLVKYFSGKFLGSKKISKTNLQTISSPAVKNIKNIGVALPKTKFHNNKFNCNFSNNIQVYVFNFLFLKIYKSKVFLALNYYKMKVCNYKIMLIYYNNLLNENSSQSIWLMKKKPKLKINFKHNLTNSSFKTTLKKFKINLNSSQLSFIDRHATESCTSLSTLNFTTKLKILNYIQQFNHNLIKDFTQTNKSKINLNKNLSNKWIQLINQVNLNINSIYLAKSNKNLKPSINLKSNKLELSSSLNPKSTQLKGNLATIKTSLQLVSQVKVRSPSYKPELCEGLREGEGKLVEKNKEANWLVYPENQKYYDLSLINAQCLNDSYKHYCNLNESYKYYNFIFLNQSKKIFSPSKKLAFDKKISDANRYKPELCENRLALVEKNKIYTANFTNNTRNKIKFNGNSNILKHFQFNYKNNTLVTLMNSPYKQHLESTVSNSFYCNTNFQFFQTTNTFQNALFLIDEIIYYIEKRIPFFKIKNYILKKLAEEKNLRIKGIRVTCSGRVGGKSKKAQRSKIQSFKYGETSLHVFSSKIDFFSKNAFTSFGTLGIKVWICYY